MQRTLAKEFQHMKSKFYAKETLNCFSVIVFQIKVNPNCELIVRNIFRLHNFPCHQQKKNQELQHQIVPLPKRKDQLKQAKGHCSFLTQKRKSGGKQNKEAPLHHHWQKKNMRRKTRSKHAPLFCTNVTNK